MYSKSAQLQKKEGGSKNITSPKTMNTKLEFAEVRLRGKQVGGALNKYAVLSFLREKAICVAPMATVGKR